ncbi:hypothetical protein [Cupriavidus necator]|uniref:hypothetical protein n=1 Tax=Cupriavidus necator TaxID=106590 RepID=UPI00140F5DC2|nr:hypothetical protein [Cupriavidus necator]
MDGFPSTSWLRGASGRRSVGRVRGTGTSRRRGIDKLDRLKDGPHPIKITSRLAIREPFNRRISTQRMDIVDQAKVKNTSPAPFVASGVILNVCDSSPVSPLHRDRSSVRRLLEWNKFRATIQSIPLPTAVNILRVQGRNDPIIGGLNAKHAEATGQKSCRARYREIVRPLMRWRAIRTRRPKFLAIHVRNSKATWPDNLFCRPCCRFAHIRIGGCQTCDTEAKDINFFTCTITTFPKGSLLWNDSDVLPVCIASRRKTGGRLLPEPPPSHLNPLATNNFKR